MEVFKMNKEKADSLFQEVLMDCKVGQKRYIVYEKRSEGESARLMLNRVKDLYGKRNPWRSLEVEIYSDTLMVNGVEKKFIIIEKVDPLHPKVNYEVFKEDENGNLVPWVDKNAYLSIIRQIKQWQQVNPASGYNEMFIDFNMKSWESEQRDLFTKVYNELNKNVEYKMEFEIPLSTSLPINPPIPTIQGEQNKDEILMELSHKWRRQSRVYLQVDNPDCTLDDFVKIMTINPFTKELKTDITNDDIEVLRMLYDEMAVK